MKKKERMLVWIMVIVGIALIAIVIHFGIEFTNYADAKYYDTLSSNCAYMGQQFDAPAKYIKTYGCYLYQDGKWSLIK